MKRTVRCATPAMVILGLLGATGGAGLVPDDAPLSSWLPDGALSQAFTAQVAAEICRDHLFDASLEPIALPAGYRLLRAAELAEGDPAMAALLRLHPQARDHAVGSLCAMSVGRFVVDGTQIRSPVPVAFWWARVEGAARAPLAAAVQWVQLGSWYPKGTGAEALIRQTDPMARFTDLEVDPVSPETWRLRLQLDGETVSATIRLTSPGKPSKAVGPQVMAVPMSGEAAGFYSVYAYRGHWSRPAQGHWQAQAGGRFGRSFAVEAPGAPLATLFQQSWSAQSGLYRLP
ncbi:MAG: hypothetical protein J0L58_03890 [Burkholderiales bacterium]|nr:hypothetical protein [Burkholderiales bacterium]